MGSPCFSLNPKIMPSNRFEKLCPTAQAGMQLVQMRLGFIIVCLGPIVMWSALAAALLDLQQPDGASSIFDALLLR